MSVLAGIPGGFILERPEPTGTRCTETYESLRWRINDTLLPAQREFVDDTDHKILGYCAGFGAGKTYALCAKAICLAMDNLSLIHI